MTIPTPEPAVASVRRHPDVWSIAGILAVLWLLLALSGSRWQIEDIHSLRDAAAPGDQGGATDGARIIGTSGLTIDGDSFVLSGNASGTAEIELKTNGGSQALLVFKGSGVDSISGWAEGDSGYRVLRWFVPDKPLEKQSMTITGLPRDSGWVRVQMRLKRYDPGSVGVAPSLQTFSLQRIPERKSLLPSITLLAFVTANYLVLRAWLPPARALGVHGATLVLVFAFPAIARQVVPWVVAVELLILARSAWPLTKPLGRRLVVPVVAGIALLAIINAAPWVYNLAGDYWTPYDTQWGIVAQYMDAGLNLFNHHDFVINRAEPTPLFFPPLYPFLFGSLFKVFGPVREGLAVINMAALAALVVATYLLTLKLSGRAIPALLAALFVALWPDITLAAARTQPEFLAAVLAVWAVTVMAYLMHRPVKWMAVSGALGALAAYTRGEYLLLPVALGLIAVLLLRPAGLRRAGVLIATAVLLILPWTARNYARFDAIVPMNLGNGLSLILGVAQVQSSGEKGLVESDDWAGMHDGVQDKPYWSPEREQARVNWAFRVIRENFGWYVTHLPNRWKKWVHADNDIYGRGNPGVYSRSHLQYDGGWEKWLYDVTRGQAQRATVVGLGPGAKVLLLLGFVVVCSLLAILSQWRNLLLYAMLPLYLFLIFTPFRLEGRYLTAAWPVMAAVCVGLIDSLVAPAVSGTTASASG